MNHSILRTPQLFSFLFLVVLSVSVGSVVLISQKVRQTDTTAKKTSAANCAMRFTVGAPSSGIQMKEVRISPGTLVGLQPNRIPVRMSTSVYDQNGNDITSKVSIQWGVSSNSSVGSIHPQSNNSLATFIPLQSGNGDLFVTATYADQTMTGSIPIELHRYTFSLIPAQRYSVVPRNRTLESFFFLVMDEQNNVLKYDTSRFQIDVTDMNSAIVFLSQPAILPYCDGFHVRLGFQSGSRGTSPVSVTMRDKSSGAVVGKTTIYVTATDEEQWKPPQLDIDRRYLSCTTSASSSPTALPTASPTASPLPTPNSTIPRSFTFSIKMHGLESMSTNKLLAKVSFGPMNSQDPLRSYSISLSPKGNGIYTGTIDRTNQEPLPSNMWISVKAHKHGQRIFANQPVLKDWEDFDLTNKPILPGDLRPQDGLINLEDLNTVVGILSQGEQTEDDIETADVNYDGTVNAADMSMILSGLSSRPDETL